MKYILKKDLPFAKKGTEVKKVDQFEFYSHKKKRYYHHGERTKSMQL